MQDERGRGDPVGPGGEELLRLVIESSSDIAIMALDPAGRVTSWNTGAERLLGWAADDILGRDGDVTFTPEDRAAGAPAAERRTALARGRAEDERWHMRKDGSRFWGSGLLMPLADRAAGFVKILRDRTLQHRAAQALRESEERFRALATGIPQLVFRSRVTGWRTWGSPQWEVFTGLSDARSRGLGWLDAVHPGDREATLAAWTRAEETGSYYVEHRIRRADNGGYRWHQTRAAPLPDGDGSATEWVGTSADIHDMRGLQERQQMLLAELQHRTRNLLAVVQATARLTMRGSASLEEFAREYESRLRALSRVQGLLARASRETLDLGALVEVELAAHGGGEAAEVRVEGPPVELPTDAVQALALALHELATNAVKHGALGRPSGRLEVTWRVEDGDGRARRVTLDWRESGVALPEAGRPARKGYGSELIERALPYQLGAETSLEYGPDGVRCRITMPITHKSEVSEHHG